MTVCLQQYRGEAPLLEGVGSAQPGGSSTDYDDPFRVIGVFLADSRRRMPTVCLSLSS